MSLMGSDTEDEAPPESSIKPVVIKLPRAVFEDAVAKLDDKKVKKRKKRKKVFTAPLHHKKIIKREPPPPFEGVPCSIFSPPPSPPSEPADEEFPLPTSRPLPLPLFPKPAYDDSTERPTRESKKKFYKLLSSVVKGDVVDGSLIESDRENIPPSNKERISLSKTQKKTIAQLLRHRLHFPAEISTVDGKGTGVKTARDLAFGQFICEYAGELITKTEALKREKLYAATSRTYAMSCYMYFFEHGGQELCIDATKEEGHGIGRLINHSIDGNVATVKVLVEGVPRLAFVAKREIKAGEELTYDYGDRGHTSLAAFPWLKS